MLRLSVRKQTENIYFAYTMQRGEKRLQGLEYSFSDSTLQEVDFLLKAKKITFSI